MYGRQDGWGEETDGWQDKILIVGLQSGLHNGDRLSTGRVDGWVVR